MKRLCAAFFLLAAQWVWAAPAATVEAVQFPAWLDRNNLSVPLTAGVELNEMDQVRTGANGRLLLRLPEGSMVKLGQNATFQIEKAKPVNGVFQGALNVLEGAFRFTTDVLVRKHKRNVNVTIAKNITIGIRGTDLWGRGREDKDLVCLIEGNIEVKGNDGKSVTLKEPLEFFQSTRSAPPLPVGKIEIKQLEEWGKETELESGQAAATGKGAWRLVLSGFANQGEARQANRALRGAGYPGEVGSLNTVQIVGISDEAGAKALGAALQGKYGIKSFSTMP